MTIPPNLYQRESNNNSIIFPFFGGAYELLSQSRFQKFQMNDIILNTFYASRATMYGLCHKKKLESTGTFDIFNRYSKMSRLP